MTHLFRPADPTVGATPPVGTWTRLLRAKGVGVFLLRCAHVTKHPRTARLITYLVLFAGLVVQAVLILTAAYLVDLALSLMGLWADLARKHLELTL